MVKSSFSPLRFFVAFFFSLMGILVISRIIIMSPEQVEKLSLEWYEILLFTIAPFGLFWRIREYWVNFYKKEFSRLVLIFFFTGSLLLYVAVIFGTLFLLLLKTEQFQLSFFYVKMIAGILTTSFVVIMFFTERKKIRTQIKI